MDDSLTGVPHIGAGRRAALEAAGITTRAQLAQLTLDQLVGMTRMPRSLAHRALAVVNQSPLDGDAHPAEPLAEPLVEELGETFAPGLAPRPEDGSLVADAPTELERAVLRLQTVLSDATRAAAHPKLHRQLVKLAALLDVLPRRAGERLKPKQTRRVVERLGEMAEQLAPLAVAEFVPLKEQDKLREELRVQRKTIEALLESARARAAKPPRPRKR